MRIAHRLLMVASCAAAMLAGVVALPAIAQPADEKYFPETGHTVQGVFLDYWKSHGALTQQGYPLSEEMFETSELDGKKHKVQYFERAVFERHSENKPPYDVLLMQLGTFRYKAKYGDAGAPNQHAHTEGGELFKETGFYVGGAFLQYWKNNGRLAQQGYPISNEFTEVSDLDGKPYVVQYFERAVFEMHPENKPPYDVLLSQLGTFRLREKYKAAPDASGVTPTVVQTPGPTSQATQTGGTGGCKPVDDTSKSKIAHTGPLSISNVHYDGQEYVELKNGGDAAVDLGGWVLRDKNDTNQSYTFPPGTRIEPGGTIQVCTEAGHPYSFGSKSSIWNNCGDAVELLDAGGTVVATYAYGTHLIR
jgi:hypothetical protein